MKKPKEIRAGDTWVTKSRVYLTIEAYTPGFIIHKVSLLDYRVIPENKFRRDYEFCYANPEREPTYFEKFKDKYNSFIERLFI